MAKLLDFVELASRGVLFGRRHVDRLEARGEFPRRVRVGAHRVAWLAEEIDAYVDAQIAKRSFETGRLGSQSTERTTENAA